MTYFRRIIYHLARRFSHQKRTYIDRSSSEMNATNNECSRFVPKNDRKRIKVLDKLDLMSCRGHHKTVSNSQADDDSRPKIKNILKACQSSTML